MLTRVGKLAIAAALGVGASVLAGCSITPDSVCADYDQPNPVSIHLPESSGEVHAVALCTGAACTPTFGASTTTRSGDSWVAELDGTPDGPGRVALFDAAGIRLHEEPVDLQWTDVRFGADLQCRSGGRADVWVEG
ncbi:hypothetical protein NS263_02520 [Curtobacterium oceanosedimentum]|uniref:Lipoprotein n=1 Tax=Curtobacterium oceanosedimentum TaxID=465820 RepID=A0ABR5S9B4_9MICO|nr:hypothetical protein [Curtobacterium oceanosedimentum]KTR42255.1 hypothetical protein NS263_02520 [Curtobacterium oceanosedimentum]